MQRTALRAAADAEQSRAGLFGGHHVRKWLPAKHRRPQARGAMPGLVWRNACKTLAESSARLSRALVRRAHRLTSSTSVLQAFGAVRSRHAAQAMRLVGRIPS